MQKINAPWKTDIILLTLFVGLFYFAFLGTRPLFVPDEGRYAEIAREMVANGDFITPFLNGIKYFEKPILFYWLGAVAIKIGGLNLWSLRSINALIAIMGVVATYATAYQLYDRKTALLSASILATSVLYFVMGHMVSLDAPVSVFIAICLFALLLAHKTNQDFYILLASVAAALALLTKGLIGIVFPGLILFIWLTLNREWRWIYTKRFVFIASFALFLLITVPWHFLVTKYNPEFFHFYFIEQHFLRYTQEDIGHYQPAWYFIPVLVFGFFPWILFLPQSLMRKLNKSDGFFVIWALSIFLFFSFSKSKLIPYILPIFPPLAILVARHFMKGSQLNLRFSAIIYLLCALAFAICLTFLFNIPFNDPLQAKLSLILLSGLLLFGGSFYCMYAYQNKLNAAIKTMIATSSIVLLLFISMIPAIDTRTILPLAEILHPILTQDDKIITFNQYYQDLPFYLKRKVSILNWRNEMSFGMAHQTNAREWMIDDDDFWQAWHGQHRVFAILDNSSFANLQDKFPHEKFYVLGKTRTNMLISNVKT